MNTEFEGIAEVLKKAFQVEVDGFTFYSMAAERTTKPAVRKLFERLARDETEHQAYIRAVMRRYEEHGASSFHFDPRDPDLAEFSSEIFTESFKEQALGEVSETRSSLDRNVQLESNAVAFFDHRGTATPQNLRSAGFYTAFSPTGKGCISAP